MRNVRCDVPRAAVCAVGVLLFLTAGALRAAQPTQPADEGGPAGAAGAGDYRSAPPGMNGAGMNGAGDPYRGYVTDYPATEIQAVPVSRAEAVRARAEYNLTQDRLHRWIDRSWDDFENSREFVDASNAEKTAAANYERERKRVVDRLMQDSGYRALIDLVAEMRGKIDQNRPRGVKATFDETENSLAMATLKLGYASTATAMEAAALAADQGVQDARTKLMDAAAKTRDMRRDFDRRVRRDPQFLASQATLDQARVNRVVSGAFLESAINAREIALDYSYYLHRWDQYKYSVYGVYGYPGYGNYGNYGRGGYPPVLPVDYYSGPYMRRY